MTISWPLAQVFSVLVVCTTALAWHGTIPSHAFFAVGGAILGYLIPRTPSIGLVGYRPQIVGVESPPPADSFPREEIPTKPELTTAAGTVIMKQVKKEDLDKR